MVYFIDIQPTRHYLDEHARDVSWETVVALIFSIKNPRKKGDTFEIEQDGFYIVFTIRDNILYVINAKKVN